MVVKNEPLSPRNAFRMPITVPLQHTWSTVIIRYPCPASSVDYSHVKVLKLDVH